MTEPPQPAHPIDLHVHSTFSDGELTPLALVARAAALGVAGLALTDHDTVAGLIEAEIAATERGLAFIGGIELSARVDPSGREVHLLGYFVDPTRPQLRETLAGRRAARVRRLHAICARLAELDCPLDPEAILASARGNVGRPHVAQALISAGYARDTNDAFRRYLGRAGRAYVPAGRLAAHSAIELIHDAGGVAVFAHPGVESIDSAIADLTAAGLDGLEVAHPAHDEGQRARYRRLARENGLVGTGGSDFHHPTGSAEIGTCGVDRETLDALARRRPAVA